MLSLVASGACARRDPPSLNGVHPASSSVAARTGVLAAIAGEGDGASSLMGDAAAPAGPWAEAVRLEKWDEAALAIDALPESDRARPEVRYVRARVGLERGEHAKSVMLLAGLEPLLPLLEGAIASARAEAQRVAGPCLESGEYFAARITPSSQLKASDAFERGKDLPRAKMACDRVIASDKKTRGQEAEARARRLRLQGDVADARWLAVHAPDLAASKDADAALARLDGGHPLTQEELVTRARALGDGGRVDDALKVFEKVPMAPGKAVPAIDRLRARADVLFRARSRYLDAARLLNEASAMGGPHAGEDAVRAARALARADKDDDAVAAYQLIARKFPKTPWSDQATYNVPYLQMLHGRYREAARGFDDYVKQYPGGTERRDAPRNRAIAHLLAKDAKIARKLFEELADDARGDTLARARMLTMAALAALQDGDRTHAIARWTEVARSQPLSWPAMVARARLTAAAAPLPPIIDPPDPSPPLPPLTAQAVSLPPPADLLHRIGLDEDAELALRDRESVLSAAAAPGRGVEALCQAYAGLGRAKRRFHVAQQIPNATLAAAPSARTRWAWECAYPMPYAEHVRNAEALEELPTGLVYAVMRQESWYDPDAVSPARAIGLLQLMPETAVTVAGAMGIPHEESMLTSPPHNIKLGAHFLKDLVSKFKGQLPFVVAGYNAGPEAVVRWSGRAPDLDMDVFVERIAYAETRNYVVRVMGNYARYAFLEKGEAGVPTLQLTP